MDAGTLIDQHIEGLGGWRKKTMTELRRLISGSSPELEETWKWNTPVWSYNGKVNICALGAFKEHIKVNFFDGAVLPDPNGLFNAGLDAKKTRSIDVHEGDRLNKAALRKLVRTAVELRKK